MSLRYSTSALRHIKSLASSLFYPQPLAETHRAAHSGCDSMVYQNLIGFHLGPGYCKQNKEGRAASEMLVSNPTPEAERSLCTSVTFLLSSQCPLVSFHIRSSYIRVMDRREYKKVDPLKYGRQRDTVVHILIDFYLFQVVCVCTRACTGRTHKESNSGMS